MIKIIHIKKVKKEYNKYEIGYAKLKNIYIVFLYGLTFKVCIYLPEHWFLKFSLVTLGRRSGTLLCEESTSWNWHIVEPGLTAELALQDMESGYI